MQTKIIKIGIMGIVGIFLILQSTSVFAILDIEESPIDTVTQNNNDKSTKEEDTSEPSSPGGKSQATFNVSKYLKVDEQKTDYFAQKDVSPIAAFILRVIDFLVKIIGTVAFLVLIFGGLIFITSGGNETQITKGKDIMKYAIIGLIAAFSSYILATFVQNLIST